MKKLLALFAFCMIVLLSAAAVSADWINLDGGEVKVNDSKTLDGFTKATWNMWVKQDSYTQNAGLVGKYAPRTGQRSYLIRTSLVNGTSIVLTADGVNAGSYTTLSTRACGMRENGKWTMLTVTYNGSMINYYRNGILCDQDKTIIPYLFDSPSPVRLGGGNSIFFSGSIDEFTIYNNDLAQEQVLRMYNESDHGTMMGQSIPVLVYHKIESPADETIDVTPEDFRQQMAYLNASGFTSITMADYNSWRMGGFVMPKKAIILVFDDGWKTVYTAAKPIMDEYGLVGSVPTVVKYASYSSNTSGYMRWDEIQALSSDGWSIESHGITHDHMLTLNESAFRNQMISSKQILTNKTGKAPTSYVFPFHESNSAYTKICGEYYDLCWTQGSLNPSYDFKTTSAKVYLGLRRINVIDTTSFPDFARFLGRDTGKAGEWYMEEGFGATTQDSSGNNNIGTLLTGAYWSDVAAKTMMGLTQNIMSNDDVNIIHSDKGEKPRLLIQRKPYPENMAIEEDRFYPDLVKEKKDKKDKGLNESQ